MTTSSQIVKAAIYPAIGIARVGNSPDEFFIGPEIPWPTTLPAGSYKDARGALKRQAARFRVYGLDGRGEVVRELTADDAQIIWKVQVANKKAAWYEFDVAMDIPQAKPVSLRNSNITDRAQLSIDPGPLTITGKDQSGAQYRFDKGRFLGEPVYLGELRTDEVGRLLFLGGHGISRSPFGNNPPTTFANNDGWCDDVSDGPVDAEVVYQGQRLEVEGAWVATTPPNFAPDLISVQTLWDVIFDTLNGLYVTAKAKPSFMADILPLFNQFSMTQWVNKGFFASYGYGQPYDFSESGTALQAGDGHNGQDRPDRRPVQGIPSTDLQLLPPAVDPGGRPQDVALALRRQHERPCHFPERLLHRDADNLRLSPAMGRGRLLTGLGPGFQIAGEP